MLSKVTSRRVPRKGVTPNASSYIRMPRDHQSTSLPCPTPLMISGAKYSWVCVWDVCVCVFVCVQVLQGLCCVQEIELGVLCILVLACALEIMYNMKYNTMQYNNNTKALASPQPHPHTRISTTPFAHSHFHNTPPYTHLCAHKRIGPCLWLCRQQHDGGWNLLPPPRTPRHIHHIGSGLILGRGEVLFPIHTRPRQHLGDARALDFGFGWRWVGGWCGEASHTPTWGWGWGCVFIGGFDDGAVEEFSNDGGFANALTVAQVKVGQQQVAVFGQQQVLKRGWG